MAEPWFVLHGHKIGGHFHCSLFAGKGFGKRGHVGNLIMDERDWEQWGKLAADLPERFGRVERPPTFPDIERTTWACEPCMKGRCSECTSTGPEGHCFCDREGHPPPDSFESLGIGVL